MLCFTQLNPFSLQLAELQFEVLRWIMVLGHFSIKGNPMTFNSQNFEIHMPYSLLLYQSHPCLPLHLWKFQTKCVTSYPCIPLYSIYNDGYAEYVARPLATYYLVRTPESPFYVLLSSTSPVSDTAGNSVGLSQWTTYFFPSSHKQAPGHLSILLDVGNSNGTFVNLTQKTYMGIRWRGAQHLFARTAWQF